MNRFFIWCTRNVFWIVALVLCKTLRVRRVNSSFFENKTKEKSPSVIAFWHGSMLLGWFLHRPDRPERVSALVSQSTDGEILSSVLERWGYSMIRGSSHIGGREAMELMIDAVKNGSSLCITPDGSTGPRHKMKIGAVIVAQQTHTPLILAGIALKRKIRLESWDRFEIPLPFSTACICYGEPIWIPENERDEVLNKRLLATEDELVQLHIKAEKILHKVS